MCAAHICIHNSVYRIYILKIKMVIQKKIILHKPISDQKKKENVFCKSLQKYLYFILENVSLLFAVHTYRHF